MKNFKVILFCLFVFLCFEVKVSAESYCEYYGWFDKLESDGTRTQGKTDDNTPIFTVYPQDGKLNKVLFRNKEASNIVIDEDYLLGYYESCKCPNLYAYVLNVSGEQDKVHVRNVLLQSTDGLKELNMLRGRWCVDGKCGNIAEPYTNAGCTIESVEGKLCSYTPVGNDGNQFNYRYIYGSRLVNKCIESGGVIEEEDGSTTISCAKYGLVTEFSEFNQIYLSVKKDGAAYSLFTGPSPYPAGLNWHNQTFNILSTNKIERTSTDKCPKYAHFDSLSGNDSQELITKNTPSPPYYKINNLTHNVYYFNSAEEASKNITHELLYELYDNEVKGVILDPDDKEEIKNNMNWKLTCTYEWPQDCSKNGSDKCFKMMYGVEDGGAHVELFDEGSKYPEYNGEFTHVFTAGEETIKNARDMAYADNPKCLELKVIERNAFNGTVSWADLTPSQYDHKFQYDYNFFFDKDSFCTGSVQGVFTVIGWVIWTVKILVPIILIVMGSIELGKAIIASKEDEIKKAGFSLGKKAAIGILIFFIPTIIEFIVGIIDKSDIYNGTFGKCTQCMMNPNHEFSEGVTCSSLLSSIYEES